MCTLQSLTMLYDSGSSGYWIIPGNETVLSAFLTTRSGPVLTFVQVPHFTVTQLLLQWALTRHSSTHYLLFFLSLTWILLVTAAIVAYHLPWTTQHRDNNWTPVTEQLWHVFYHHWGYFFCFSCYRLALPICSLLQTQLLPLYIQPSAPAWA